MTAVAIFIGLVILAFVFKFLNVTSPPRLPKLVCVDSEFLNHVLKYCPHLHESYVPVRFWGASGHIQTLVHATFGRTFCPNNNARRACARQPDGTTVTWDIYEPLAPSQFTDDFTIAICPGIANSSESVYVQALVSLAGKKGFRCIVLNHIGVLSNVKVTSPRLFRYGNTDDYNLMIEKFLESNPNTKLLLVGFSMGGNLICKYLGESRKKPSCIVGGISICQGYDAIKTLQYLLSWNNLARLYLYSLTEGFRTLIIRHKDVLLSDDIKKRFNIDERRVLSAGTLLELDEHYTRRIAGFKTSEELYRNDSCVNYMYHINVPLIMVNARDDPIIHTDLLKIPENFAKSRTDTMYVETDHGGHLAYYDKGFFIPNAITWMDRTVVGLAIALAAHVVKKPIN